MLEPFAPISRPRAPRRLIWDSASQASCFHATKSVRPTWRSAANSACAPFAVTSAPGSTGPGAIASRTLLVRGCRLADSYLPLAGPHDREPALVGGMVDVPASRFLRPVSGNAALERLRLWRITSAMETAARRRRLFHLWWHPHNFGVDLPENLAFLRKILDHFRILQDRYGMRSMTMAAVADEVLNAHGQSGAAHQ